MGADCNNIRSIQSSNFELIIKKITNFTLGLLKEFKSETDLKFSELVTFESYSKNLKAINSIIERNEENKIIKFIYNIDNSIVVKELIRDDNGRVVQIQLRGPKLPNSIHFKRTKNIIRNEKFQITGVEYLE